MSRTFPKAWHILDTQLLSVIMAFIPIYFSFVSIYLPAWYYWNLTFVCPE